MATRLELQALLVATINSSNVYFDPPSSVVMSYPAIVYKLDTIRTDHADNRPYMSSKRYQVIVIDSNPDTTLVDSIASLPSAGFQRSYKANNLHHFVFNLFF